MNRTLFGWAVNPSCPTCEQARHGKLFVWIVAERGVTTRAGCDNQIDERTFRLDGRTVLVSDWGVTTKSTGVSLKAKTKSSNSTLYCVAYSHPPWLIMFKIGVFFSKPTTLFNTFNFCIEAHMLRFPPPAQRGGSEFLVWEIFFVLIFRSFSMVGILGRKFLAWKLAVAPHLVLPL